MNKISSITKALDADLSFYLFKGSELDTINLVSDYYKRKNINTSILNGSDLSAENAKDLVGILNVQSPEKLILIIRNFDMISIQSQNILLKILENLGDKLMKTENFEMALDEIVWLITLLANQSVLVHNLKHKDTPRTLLTEEEVELLTSPLELSLYKNAIMESLYRGTNRNIVSEADPKNAEVG